MGRLGDFRKRLAIKVAAALVVVAPVAVVAGASPAAAASNNPAGCTMYIDYPHESGHNPGRVNVTVRFSCARPVNMYMSGLLLRSRWYGLQQMGSNSANVYGKSSYSLAVNAVCPGGVYTWLAYGATSYRYGNIVWNSSGPSSARQLSC